MAAISASPLNASILAIALAAFLIEFDFLPTTSLSSQNNSYSRWAALVLDCKILPSLAFNSGVINLSSLDSVCLLIQCSGTFSAFALLTAKK